MEFSVFCQKVKMRMAIFAITLPQRIKVKSEYYLSGW